MKISLMQKMHVITCQVSMFATATGLSCTTSPTRCFKRWTKTKSKTTSTGSKQSMVSQIPLLDDTLSRNAVNADRDYRTSCKQLVMGTASCYQVNRKLPVSNTR